MDIKDPKILMELIKLAQQGDQDAFSDIYNNYFVPIYRYIFIRTGRRREEAEELTQEVFLRVFSNLKKFEFVGANPLSYFFTIARNLLTDYYRKNSHKEIISEDVLESAVYEGESPQRFVEKQEISKIVNEAIKILTDEQQEIIILKFINELENREIAELIGKSEEAIRQTQHRSLQKMREYISRTTKNI